jgi:hypothetical protein
MKRWRGFASRKRRLAGSSHRNRKIFHGAPFQFIRTAVVHAGGMAIAPLSVTNPAKIRHPSEAKYMKRTIKLALSAVLAAGVAAIAGPAFSLNKSANTLSPAAMYNAPAVRRSIIRVHTDRGVITLPGTATSWTEVDNAIFVADSIADVQMVNNEVPWRVQYE